MELTFWGQQNNFVPTMAVYRKFFVMSVTYVINQEQPPLTVSTERVENMRLVFNA